jgi:hypothetical protein
MFGILVGAVVILQPQSPVYTLQPCNDHVILPSAPIYTVR